MAETGLDSQWERTHASPQYDPQRTKSLHRASGRRLGSAVNPLRLRAWDYGGVCMVPQWQEARDFARALQRQTRGYVQWVPVEHFSFRGIDCKRAGLQAWHSDASGNRSLHLARAVVSISSTLDSSQLRAMASSLTRRERGRYPPVSAPSTEIGRA